MQDIKEFLKISVGPFVCILIPIPSLYITVAKTVGSLQISPGLFQPSFCSLNMRCPESLSKAAIFNHGGDFTLATTRLRQN